MAKTLEAYKRMSFIRIAEQEIANLYLREKIMSFVHFYVGQEAVAVGVCDALGTEDKILGNHRSHGHYLARGGDLKRMVCELLGKAEGCARGKGGSMHMIDLSVNFVGSTPILGSVVPLACGTAFEQKYNKKNGLTVAFLGDGAFEEGVVYETLNLAALFKVPLLLVVENNFNAVNSQLKDRRSDRYDTEAIVTGFGVQYFQADGTDYHDVYKKASAAVSGIRKTNIPVVLECITHRHMAHSAPIFDEGYRSADTADKRAEQDSIKKLRDELLRGGVSEAELVTLEDALRKDVLESIEFSVRAKFPEVKELYSDIYA